MAKIRVLASWVGHRDLLAMSVGQPESVRQQIARITDGQPPPKEGAGPIKALLGNETFDRVLLLSNYPPVINKAYAAWLHVPVATKYIPLDDRTGYGEIFTKVDAVLRTFLQGFKDEPPDLSILLSPGTSAMTAVWVLLGKSRYPATFYQTDKDKSWRTEIPFDLVVDFVPEVFRNADGLLQRMAGKSPQETEGFEGITGDSKAIRLSVGRAKRAALRNVPVLLLGESGTGKEMFARAIHAASPRKAGPFEAVNCAAIPHELLESALFGHVKDAFTGARTAHKGAFERANEGTLFLDEIGECDLAIQTKLLRVLQPPHGEGPSIREYQPVGSERIRRSDVRVIAATNRNLLAAVESGKIREDLYYRLAVISIRLPALRERRSDIPALALALLDQINADFARGEPGYRHKTLSASATAIVKGYAWPGNVRQLYNALVQAAVMAEDEELSPEDLAAAIAEAPATASTVDPLEVPLGNGFDLAEQLGEIQRHYLQRAMAEAGGVKAEAARLLGMKNYQTLDGQLKRLGVRWTR